MAQRLLKLLLLALVPAGAAADDDCAAAAAAAKTPPPGNESGETTPSTAGVAPEASSWPWVNAPMPERIAALVNEQWGDLDPDAPRIIAALSGKKPFMEFAHARSTFRDHLVGTFGTLGVWGQPEDVRRAGLFHTAYVVSPQLH